MSGGWAEEIDGYVEIIFYLATLHTYETSNSIGTEQKITPVLFWPS